MQYEYPEELSDYALTDTTAAVAFDGIQRKTGTLAVFRSDLTEISLIALFILKVASLRK